MKSITFLVAALTAAGSVLAVSGAVEATYGDSRACTSNPEYNAIKWGYPMTRVHSITEGKGVRVETSEARQERGYRRCEGGIVSVRYLRGSAGVWRVVGKSAVRGETDTRACTTGPEYNATKRGFSMSKVHLITEGQGKKVDTWSNGQQRDYRRCGGGTVSVRYLRGSAGVWRVVGKSATLPLTVERWIDGDTVKARELRSSIRIIGIDAPEGKTLCGPGATRHANAIAPVGSKLTVTVRMGTDAHNRHLMSLSNHNGYDFGARMIMRGQADARYDSRDGYATHPKETLYRSLDARYPDTCTVTSSSSPQPPSSSTERWNRPVSATNPDLDCSDIRRRVRVYPPDYHRLDADGDGWGCESYS